MEKGEYTMIGAFIGVVLVAIFFCYQVVLLRKKCIHFNHLITLMVEDIISSNIFEKFPSKIKLVTGETLRVNVRKDQVIEYYDRLATGGKR